MPANPNPTPVERIWLQWADENGETTWCAHGIDDNDVEYVRADLAATRLAEAERQADEARARVAVLKEALTALSNVVFVEGLTVGNTTAWQAARAALAASDADGEG